MALKRLLCLAGVFCMLFAEAARCQDLGPQPGRDPFELGIGSSFDASRSNRPVSALRPESVSRDLEEALTVIQNNYASPASTDVGSLAKSAISSMLKTLDPHSNYYPPAEFQAMLDEHASEFTGTGMLIASFEKDGVLETFVMSVLAGSPAAKAGLRFGDKILSVDGQKATGKPIDEVRDMLRGRRNSTAAMTISRGPLESQRTISMKRERLHDTSVPKGFVMRGGVGYIDVTNGFSNSTYTEFEAALADIKRQGALSLVVDLRGNGGGILDQAIKMAERFLPAGSVIVSQRGRTAAENRTWRAAKGLNETMPLILLVDGQSASAAEVVAGALQDNDRALIVGQRTFGKGLVQSVLNLPEGAGLTLTAARYFTPAGRSIQREYADTGLYDYFNHRGQSEIDKPVYAARTLTDRIVYGGDGISPDVRSRPLRFTQRRIRLLGPIFHFALKLLNTAAASGEAAVPARKTASYRAFIGQTIVTSFREYLNEGSSWAGLVAEADEEKEFVREMLEYYLAMGVSGIDAATRARVESDPEVAAAVTAMPRAAELTSAAQTVRRSRQKQKRPLSLVLSGQR